jgi:hypothetical protein
MEMLITLNSIIAHWMHVSKYHTTPINMRNYYVPIKSKLKEILISACVPMHWFVLF